MYLSKTFSLWNYTILSQNNNQHIWTIWKKPSKITKSLLAVTFLKIIPQLYKTRYRHITGQKSRQQFIHGLSITKTDILRNQSFAAISDRILHDHQSVHVFKKYLVNKIKVKYPHVRKIYYFTDGCPNQYKCRQNLINVVYPQNRE